MSENNSPSRHVSYDQVKTIIDYMGQHVEFARGSLRSLEARHTSKRLWGELTKILNSSRGGTIKTYDGWSKYWSDFKNKLKNKAHLMNRKKSKSAALKRGMRPLTKLEKRALVILGPNFMKSKPKDGHNDKLSNHLPPEVKQETYQETATNDFCKRTRGSVDRISGDKDSEESTESSEEEYVEPDENSDEPLSLRNIYPKWLIEVEKKRADAELTRARAEEQRVVVATKTAEAALAQAEALKRLSEAANKQADAIMRIAMVLESRGTREDMLAI